VKQADYTNAEAALRAFIQAHPRDPLVASAQYWIGETLYARKQYPEAASAFADGYKRFPKGPKAPEELLKLGMALGHTNQKQNACVAFAELDHAFPNANPAIRRAAGEEKHRLSCS
jgi:tol-pal system protein YbgF